VTDPDVTHFIMIMLSRFKAAVQQLMNEEWKTTTWPIEDQKELPAISATAMTMYLIEGCRAANMNDEQIIRIVRRTLAALPRVQ